MASDLSKYLGNLVCRWIAGNAMPAPPATVYLALFNGDPKASGTEITTTIRPAGRLAVDWDAIAADGVDNVLTNDALVDFGDADAGATLTHTCVFDDDTGGNKIASRVVPGGTIVVAAGTGVKFNIGDVNFTIGS